MDLTDNLIIQILVYVSPRIEYENYAMQHLMQKRGKSY